jgi:hypothetical protein
MPNKKALIVAINDYPGERNDLPSCLDDAHAFERILTDRFGFDRGGIESYFDASATLQTVRDRLTNWLLKDVGPDDRLVFYYSGHGWRTERDGILRECLCLHDDFLFDDELVRTSQELPVGVLTLVLDSCHSGGLSKPFFVEQAGTELTENKVWRPDADQQDQVTVAEKTFTPVKPFGRPAVMLSEPPLKAAKTFQTDRLTRDADLAQAADPELYPVPDAADAADGSDLELNGLLLSACQADQTAAASTAATTTQEPRERLSAFTFALRRSLDGLLASEGSVDRISAARLLEATANELKGLGFKQTPLLQETSKSAGLGAYAFVNLRPIGGPIPAPGPGPAVPAPSAATPATPVWLTPDFQRLIEELTRALAPADAVQTERQHAFAGRK